MIQAYSKNLTIEQNGILPFNSVSLKKGNTAVLSGVSSIELNRSGIYQITLNLSGLPTSAGDVTVIMNKDGVALPQGAISIPTVLTTQGIHGSVTTPVIVERNNNGCCCSSPTTIQFVNTGVGLSSVDLNVVVTKLC